MPRLKVISDPKVSKVIGSYPPKPRAKLRALRRLVLEAAREIDGLESLEECLKWGEPSYLTKKGSTIRIDWKPKSPDQYAIYFKCTTKLVPTFKKKFGKTFNFESNRAIVFRLDQRVPSIKLKKCIRAALTYHKVKGLRGLGIA